MEDNAHTTNNIGEFLRVALANGPVGVLERYLETGELADLFPGVT